MSWTHNNIHCKLQSQLVGHDTMSLTAFSFALYLIKSTLFNMDCWLIPQVCWVLSWLSKTRWQTDKFKTFNFFIYTQWWHCTLCDVSVYIFHISESEHSWYLFLQYMSQTFQHLDGKTSIERMEHTFWRCSEDFQVLLTQHSRKFTDLLCCNFKRQWHALSWTFSIGAVLFFIKSCSFCFWKPSCFIMKHQLN